MSEDQLTPIIVIIGITGDLSKRYLLPALYHLLKDDTLPSATRIIGTSRQELTSEELLKTVELCVLEKDQVCDQDALIKVKNSFSTIKLDPDNPEDYDKLKSVIEEEDKEHNRTLMFFMSIPSSAYKPIIDQLASHGLNGARTRLLLEKPFGYDENSAKALINEVDQAFKEDQVYRIDHYLAKETAQNLLAFRIHNPIFRPLWNCQHIKSICVRVIEKIGIEGRANFYEQTGALRDIIQSHSMQLLSIIMMDLPEGMDSAAIHEAKQKFFSELVPADPKDAIRGQYEGYKEEVNNPSSFVETYAKVCLHHNSDTWRNTHIELETGKSMNKRSTDVVIEFETEHEEQRNNLTFRIQPEECIDLDLVVKKPGLGNEMHHTSLSFNYREIFKDTRSVSAYEKVLMDAVRGDRSLFASSDEVLQTWRVLQPVLQAWSSSGDGLISYSPGATKVEP